MKTEPLVREQPGENVRAMISPYKKRSHILTSVQ